MRVLAVTNMYPTPETPTAGLFIEAQVEGLRRIGVDVEVLLLNRLLGGAKVYRGLGRRLAPFFEGGGAPDLVHAMYGGVMAERVVASIGGRVPVVVTFHGSDLQGSPLSPPHRRILAFLGVRASKIAAGRAAGIVAVSEHLVALLPRSVDRRRVRVIPCGIDLRRFVPMDRESCRRELAWEADSFCVLFATGNDDPVKRPGLARAAVDLLRAEGVGAVLKVMHGVPYADVPKWINASDVLLLTSFREGSPTIVKEALACDVPIVSTPAGDVSEQIAGVSGCYMSSAEPSSLAEKLSLVHGAGGRVTGRWKVAPLAEDVVAARLRDFYAEVLSRFAERREVSRS